MQLRQSSFLGPTPACPIDAQHPVHAHGSYERYRSCDSHDQFRVARFLCVRCGHTLSVLPDQRLP